MITLAEVLDGTCQVEVLMAGEISDMLRVSKMTVLRRLDDGDIDGYRIGREWRVPVENFRAYLQQAGNFSRTEKTS